MLLIQEIRRWNLGFDPDLMLCHERFRGDMGKDETGHVQLLAHSVLCQGSAVAQWLL